MKLHIHKTKPSEYYTTENLTREIFWNLYNSGCTDHLILHNLRNSKSYIENLDLCIKQNEEIIGHIISTKAIVLSDKNQKHEVLCVGPFAIANNHQNQGIGSQLLNHLIDQANIAGFAAMVLFGNPNYYQRFGFKNAKEFGITTKDGHNFDAFMVLELYPGALTDIKGRFFEDPAFEINNDEFGEFEKRFPKKEKGDPKIKIHI